jgi:hypothetical protein
MDLQGNLHQALTPCPAGDATLNPSPSTMLGPKHCVRLLVPSGGSGAY